MSAERLSTYDIKSTGVSSNWTLGPALMSRDMRVGSHHRYCPKCVAADLQRSGGREQTRPYVRAAWMTRAAEACVEHGCIILEAATDEKAQGDFSRYVVNNLERLRDEAVTVPSAASVEVARYVENRIHGKSSNAFLDEFEAYVAVDLCRNIGHFAIQHEPLTVERHWSAG